MSDVDAPRVFELSVVLRSMLLLPSLSLGETRFIGSHVESCVLRREVDVADR